MSTKSKRHTHKYYRVGELWTCALPDCLHHMPKHYEPMLLNKGFYCWSCGEINQLREEHLKLNPKYFSETDKIPTHPICWNCANNMPKDGDIDFDVLDEKIKQIVGDK
jgi:hypothetical protein